MLLFARSDMFSIYKPVINRVILSSNGVEGIRCYLSLSHSMLALVKITS